MGLLPIGINSCFEWRERRDIRQRSSQAIEIARQRVSFLTDLMRAYEACAVEQLDAMRQEIAGDLQKLHCDLAKTLTRLEQRSSPKKSNPERRNTLQRVFLAYRPQGAIAWTLHILYYMLLGLIAMLIFVSGCEPGGTMCQAWTMEEFWAYFPPLMLGSLVILGPPMLAINLLAHRSDRAARGELRRQDEEREQQDQARHTTTAIADTVATLDHISADAPHHRPH